MQEASHKSVSVQNADGDAGVRPSIAPHRVLVFACGPDAMVRSASDAALAIGAHFHAETFEL
jgi:hypothetical protein